MKKTFLLLVFSLFTLFTNAQDYVDIVKFSNNNANLGNLDDDYETNTNNFNFELYYPKVINKNLVFLTGITAENTALNLGKNFDRGNLTMTRLNLGIKYQYNEKWSGTYVLLPKLASDFKNIGSQDFQFGALAILDYQYSEGYKWKFGLYSSTENFGTTITPIIGLWHRSKNEKFFINATLPIRMDMNYSLSKKFSIGTDLLTSIKSYNLADTGSNFYVQEESIRFAAYVAYGLLDNSLIVRGKIGYDTTDYGMYNSNDTVGVQVLTVQLGGDDRVRLNSEFDAGIFMGADLIYRFDLSKKDK